MTCGGVRVGMDEGCKEGLKLGASERARQIFTGGSCRAAVFIERGESTQSKATANDAFDVQSSKALAAIQPEGQVECKN